MTATFYVGDAVTVMNRLPEKSVDLVISSPPFLALRSYLPQDHPDKALEGGSQATPGEYIDWLLDVVEACARVLAPHGSLCFELGDTYSGSGGAGGDYNEDGLREGQPTFKQSHARGSGDGHDRLDTGRPSWPLAKSLSLIPESFRFAMVYGHNPHTGRRTEPWRLRNVIRWVRPNPPVGALGDKFRPATSELMVFCKAKDRFFDLDAVRGEVSEWTQNYADRMPISERALDSVQQGDRTRLSTNGGGLNQQGAPPLDWWNIPSDAQVRTLNYVECGCTEGCMMGQAPDQFRPATSELLVFCKSKTRFFDLDAVREPYKPGNEGGAGAHPPRWDAERGLKMGRRVGGETNERSYYDGPGAPPLDWWNIPPGGYPGAHYAVWPPELLIKPIKAMCPESVCRVCGEPSRRIVSEPRFIDRRGVDMTDTPRPARGYEGNQPVPKIPGASWGPVRTVKTLGFSDCGHDDYRPGLVLDPFAGSGTTLSVATGHGRDAIGIDLDERNYELSLDRVGPLILQRGEIRDGAAP